jgi:hypothetical protein
MIVPGNTIMIADDPFTQSYANLIDATYDVVDRIVLNGYFILGQSPGGFRTWWRKLFGGDAELDDTHLMRMAGRFSRRLRGWAEKNHIPVIDKAPGDRTCEIAPKLMPADPNFTGIFAVIVGRAPAPVWEVQRYGNNGINLRRKKPMPWVNHYSFQILDKEWGHVVIKLCGHPPFSAQIALNGHEWVACKARKGGLNFQKEENCFTDVSNAPGLSEIADALCSSSAIGRLEQVCERWIYTCLCFALDFRDQQATQFRYSYSIYQIEFSRNLLFHRGWQMDDVFDSVINRTRAPLRIKTVKKLFGCRPRRKAGRKPKCEVVVERPVYDLTIFKVHFGRLTLKMYTKGERVLRIEAIAHNTPDLGCGKILSNFPRIVERLKSIMVRFLDVVHGLDASFVDDGTLDSLPLPSGEGSSKIGGIDLNKARMRAVFEAVVALAPSPDGFTAAALATAVQQITGLPYTSRQAAYDLKKLRAKQLVLRIPRSSRYQATAPGLRTIAALSILREKILKPILAAASSSNLEPPRNVATPIDCQYHIVQTHFRDLLSLAGIAA